MSYMVKEVFLTLQGEGSQSGRRAVFCRFAGCNLWSGREQDRAAAVCRFCDTDFINGTRYDAAQLVDAIDAAWGPGLPRRLVVFTGGEPLLQLDAALIDAVRARGFYTALETNGTQPLPCSIEHVVVSPKAGAPLVLTRGDDCKVVWPQPGISLDELAALPFRQHSLQPMDGPDRAGAMAACVAHCLADPRWRLTLQTHKIAGVP